MGLEAKPQKGVEGSQKHIFYKLYYNDVIGKKAKRHFVKITL